MAWIQFVDHWTFKPTSVNQNSQHLFECKDSKSDTGHSLLVHVAATHAGVVNGNHRFYRPDSMQEGMHTWLPQKAEDGTILRTARPVLIGHDEKGDVLGRVLEAKYVDESWKYAGEYPVVKDFLFYNRDSRKRRNLFESVDWITENLVDIDHYTGLGYADLGLRITNPEAIRKVFADEYLTVSVGFKTNAAHCSICHQEWAKDGKCEHKLGQMVDRKRMFLITGDLVNQEVSFVNFPADQFATTLSKKVLTDSLSKMFFLGLPINQQDIAIAGGLLLTDGLYEQGMSATEESEPMTIDLTKLNPDELVTELKSKELTRERAFAIKDAVTAWAPEAEDLQSKKRLISSTVNTKIHKNKWDAATVNDLTVKDSVVAAELKEFMADSTKTPEEAKIVPKWNDFAADWKAGNDKDRDYFADRTGITGEVVAAVGQDSITLDIIDKLADASFAGPLKTFPAHDATYVKASLSVLEKSGITQELKDQIKANLDLKATEFGLVKDEAAPVEAASETAAVTTGADEPTVLTKVLKDEEEKAKNITQEQRTILVETLKTLDKTYDSLATGDDARWALRWAIRAMLEDWSADESVAYALANLASSKDHVVLSPSELAEKDDTINGLTAEKSTLTDEVKSLQESRIAIMSATKKSLAQSIVMHGILKGTDGYKDLTNEQRDEKITALSARHITSLRDSMSDIIVGLKFTDSTSVEKPTELAAVADNAQLTESAPAASGEVKMTDEQASALEAEQAFERKLRAMGPRERSRAIASRKFAAVAAQTTK